MAVANRSKSNRLKTFSPHRGVTLFKFYYKGLRGAVIRKPPICDQQGVVICMIFIEPAKVYVERQAAQEPGFNKLMATFRSQENDRMNHGPLDYVILNHLRELGGAITLWGMLNHLGALDQTKRREER